MKQLLLFFVLFAGFTLSAQNVTYNYDAAGNRTERIIALSASPQLRSSAETTPLEDILDEKKIKIYPNPTKGMLAVEIMDFNNEAKGEYTIHDMAGKLIQRQEAVSGRTTFDLSGQPTGIYLLRIKLNNEILTWKIVKE
jgi:hypothetical protein